MLLEDDETIDSSDDSSLNPTDVDTGIDIPEPEVDPLADLEIEGFDDDDLGLGDPETPAPVEKTPPHYFVTMDGSRNRLIHESNVDANKRFGQIFQNVDLINSDGYVDVPGWQARLQGHPFADDLRFNEYLSKTGINVDKDNSLAVREAYQQFLQTELAQRIDEVTQTAALDSATVEAIAEKTTEQVQQEASRLLVELDTQDVLVKSVKSDLETAFAQKVYPLVRDTDQKVIGGYTRELSKIAQPLIAQNAQTVIEAFYLAPDAQRQAFASQVLLEQARAVSVDQNALDKAAKAAEKYAKAWAIVNRTTDAAQIEAVKALLIEQATTALQNYTTPNSLFTVNTDYKGDTLNLGGRLGLHVQEYEYDSRNGRVEVSEGVYHPVAPAEWEARQTESLIKQELQREGLSDAEASQRASKLLLKMLRGDSSEVWGILFPGYKKTRGELFQEKADLQKNTLGMSSEARVRGKVEEITWNAIARSVGVGSGLWDQRLETQRVFNWKTGKYEFSQNREKLVFRPWEAAFNGVSGRTVGRWFAERQEKDIKAGIDILTNKQTGFMDWTAEGRAFLDRTQMLGSRQYSMIDFRKHFEDGWLVKKGKDVAKELSNKRSILKALEDDLAKGRLTANGMAQATRTVALLTDQVAGLEAYHKDFQKNFHKLASIKNTLADLQDYSRTLRRKRKDDQPDNTPFLQWLTRVLGQTAWYGTKVVVRNANAAMGNPWGERVVKPFKLAVNRYPSMARFSGFMSTNARLANLLIGKSLQSGFAFGSLGFVLAGGNPLTAALGIPIASGSLLGFGQGFLFGTFVGRHGMLAGYTGYVLSSALGITGPWANILIGSSAGLGRLIKVWEDFGHSKDALSWAQQQASIGGPWSKFWANVLKLPFNGGLFTRINPIYAPKLNGVGANKTISLFKAPWKAPFGTLIVATLLGLSPWQIVGWTALSWGLEFSTPWIQHLFKTGGVKFLRLFPNTAVGNIAKVTTLSPLWALAQIPTAGGVLGAIAAFLDPSLVAGLPILGGFANGITTLLTPWFGGGAAAGIGSVFTGSLAGGLIGYVIKTFGSFIFFSMARAYSLWDHFFKEGFAWQNLIPRSEMGAFMLYEMGAGIFGFIRGIFSGMKIWADYTKGLNPQQVTNAGRFSSTKLQPLSQPGFWAGFRTFLRALWQPFSGFGRYSLMELAMRPFRFLFQAIAKWGINLALAGRSIWQILRSQGFGAAWQAFRLRSLLGISGMGPAIKMWLGGLPGMFGQFGRWFVGLGAAFGGAWASFSAWAGWAVVGSAAMAIAFAVAVTAISLAIVVTAYNVAIQKGRATALAYGPVGITIVGNPYTCNTSIQKLDNGKMNIRFTTTVSNPASDSKSNAAIYSKVETTFTTNGQSIKLDSKPLTNGSEVPVLFDENKLGNFLGQPSSPKGKVTYVHEVNNIDINQDAVLDEIVTVTGIRGAGQATGSEIFERSTQVQNGLTSQNQVVGIDKTGTLTVLERFTHSGGCRIYIGNPPIENPFGMPTEGKITYGAFSDRSSADNSTSTFGFHKGGELDVATVQDTPIYSTMAGRAYAMPDNFPGYGYWVKVVGNEYSTYYAHLSSRHPKITQAGASGIPVQQGCLVGYMGKSGTSQVHLHYEIRYAQGDRPLYSVEDQLRFFTMVPIPRTNYVGQFITGSQLTPNRRDCF